MKMITKDEVSVGDRIRNLRLDRGYSREKVAEMAGISAKFLYEIEIKHAGFSAETLKGIAFALAVSSDYILYGRSSVEYEEKIAETIGKFDHHALLQVEQLLNIAYELSQKT